MNLKWEDWGHISYEEGLQKQLAKLEEVRLHNERECIVFCSHPSVVTLGKKSEKNDLLGWKGEIHQVTRGGRATYHGPGQIICYPILSLKKRNQDLHLHLRKLEEAAIIALAELGIIANRDSKGTGVWVDQKKIASIGVAVKRWISYHGIALNYDHDPLAFQGINPCGFNENIMTSVEEILLKRPKKEFFQEKLRKAMVKCFRVNE